jgi:dipeptidyl aminopeptidase/acylaminoacyl peptidase
MEPSDISRLITVGAPRLSPDSRTVAFVVERVDMAASCYRSAIWLAATDGSTPPVQFSAGAERDREPTWSPDGARLAFTRSTAAPEPGQTSSYSVLVAPVDGPGEVVTIAEDQQEAFGELAWSPDGRWIAYTQRIRDQRYQAAEDDRRRPPRRIDRVLNRVDSVGWTIDRSSHVFVAPVDGTSVPQQVTEGEFDHTEPAWSPDSDRLVCVSAQHEDWDIDPAVDLWVLDPTGTTPPAGITETVRAWRSPSWSPDGSRIAALVGDDHSIHRHSQVAVVDVDSGSSTVLTAALDRHCAPLFLARPPIWLGDDALLFSADDHGRVPLLRVGTDGGTPPEPVVGGDRSVVAFDASADGRTVAFCATSTTEPPELFTVTEGRERKLTTLQAGFLAACPAHPAERFTVPSLAGDGDIDVWMMRPPGFERSRHSPMLLSIHGGPTAQYGDRWFDEVQMYASAGYVVVYANPHGSTGSSEAWARAIRSPLAEDDPGTGWGGIDFEDLMAVVDAALEREPGIDPERLGVLGGSYGGYMTSWMVSHTDRFAAGCSERSCNNLLTEEWSSDLAGVFHWFHGVGAIDHPEEYLRMSPVTYVEDIHTPLLILHSEQDLRCHVEQADQLFVRLRLLGREVEYWRFPAESHELSRSGSPVHRQQRAEIILDWFGRWLK